MMHGPAICALVLDDDQYRGRENARAVLVEGGETYHHNGRHVVQAVACPCEDDRWEQAPQCKLPSTLDIAFVHKKNLDIWQMAANQGIKASVLVFYSGGGGLGKPRDEVWIQRAIVGAGDAIQPAEVREILDWLADGHDLKNLPDPLRPAESVERLQALVVLAQGYLAACALTGDMVMSRQVVEIESRPFLSS